MIYIRTCNMFGSSYTTEIDLIDFSPKKGENEKKRGTYTLQAICLYQRLREMMIVQTQLIPANIQEQVDEYVDLHKACKELESRLKKLRKEIEPFMEENELESIRNSAGNGAIHLEPSNMAIVTAQFTAYSPSILEQLGKEVAEMVMETVVDRDKLEAMVKLGVIQEDHIKPYKQFKAVRKFTVKK